MSESQAALAAFLSENTASDDILPMAMTKKRGKCIYAIERAEMGLAGQIECTSLSRKKKKKEQSQRPSLGNDISILLFKMCVHIVYCLEGGRQADLAQGPTGRLSEFQ